MTSPTTREFVIREYRRGRVATEALATRFGVDHATVIRWLSDAGHIHGLLVHACAVRDHLLGDDVETVAERYGVSVRVLQRWLRHAGAATIGRDIRRSA